MSTMYQVYSDPEGKNIGVDVGKLQLDICIHERNEHWDTGNNPTDIWTLASKLSRFKLARIGVEATGGYERDLVEACAERGLPVVVVQPMRIRNFAKIKGVIAKTDKIDAQVIAEFAVTMKPEVRPLTSKNIRAFKELLARKRQLNEARTQELNRQHKASKVAQRTHAAMIKFLDKEIAWVNEKLAKAMCTGRMNLHTNVGGKFTTPSGVLAFASKCKQQATNLILDQGYTLSKARAFPNLLTRAHF
ncbi:IS110 family transposase [Alcanivorax sp. IL3]|uniref:IS110 family transposase n=1 Tax=unclassified Alcanivorax TaxID=2638842 RepID=UPI0039C43E9E